MKVHMVDPEPTARLIGDAQAGSRRAYSELAELHRARLESLISSRIGPDLRAHVEVEDILQDTLTRGWELIERFKWQGAESFHRWLSAIAEHLILNATQKSRRRPLRLDRDRPGESTSASKAQRRDERFDRLERALSHLRPEQRKAILLSRVEGLPMSEVASRLNKSPEAVKKMITRALRQLRQHLPDTQSLHLPDRRFQLEDGNDE